MNPPRSSVGVKEPQVRRIGASDGDLLALLGAMTRIKVSSRDTLGTFFVGEARLPPKAFVPLHYHPDVEVFLVLKGTLEVMRLSDGEAEFLPITSPITAFSSKAAGPVGLTSMPPSAKVRKRPRRAPGWRSWVRARRVCSPRASNSALKSPRLRPRQNPPSHSSRFGRLAQSSINEAGWPPCARMWAF